MIKNKIVIIVFALAPLSAWAQPTKPKDDVVRAESCAAPNVMENDEAAKADRQLYVGIGVEAAICVAGAPAKQVSEDGQSVDALEYGDGRVLRFTYDHLVSIATGNSAPVVPPDPISIAPAGSCYKYLGTRVSPIGFDQAVAGLPKVPEKGEFESTAEFRARIARIAASDKPLIVAKALESKIAYNADLRKFMIYPEDFGESTHAVRGAIGGTNGVEQIFSQGDRIVGSYVASNAFGARVKVNRIDRTVRAVFHEADSAAYDTTIFNGPKTLAIGALPASPEEAKRLKPQFKAAFVLRPTPPYLERGDFIPTKGPKISDPEELREKKILLIADVECGLLLDGANKVLGAFPTRR